MLVLSRKPRESIIINGNIVVSIAAIEGNRVRLGIEAPPDVAILRAELTPHHAAGNGKAAIQGKSYRILIVEDDEVDRLMVRRCLKGAQPQQQFILSESGLGKDGLDRCRQEKPDCVLLDYRLPDISGLQFLEALRHNGVSHNIPVVLITGQRGEQIKTESLANGAQRFLAKRDLSPEKLREEIFEAMRAINSN